MASFFDMIIFPFPEGKGEGHPFYESNQKNPYFFLAKANGGDLSVTIFKSISFSTHILKILFWVSWNDKCEIKKCIISLPWKKVPRMNVHFILYVILL